MARDVHVRSLGWRGGGQHPFAWAKGHGTENDFVLLPDLDGSRARCLDADFVAALCHRRRGIGADGVLRVVRTRPRPTPRAGAEWFMDYRNADGSLAQMCGNGIRVFARWLVEEGLVDPVRAAADRHPGRGQAAGARRTATSASTWECPGCTSRPRSRWAAAG